MPTKFLCGNLVESDIMEEQGDGRIKLWWLRKVGCENDWWMELAQDHVQWQALILALFHFAVTTRALVKWK